MSKELSADTTLSHYRIVSKIGAGGMGDVYLAHDMQLGRRVALKILPPEMAADKQRMQRFIQEARTASSLNQSNILTVFEIGETASRQFIATEFVDGETLRQHMAHKLLRLREALDIAMQIASALAAAHKAGIVHRDINPQNLTLRHQDRADKVLNYGLARPHEQSQRQTLGDSHATTRAGLTRAARAASG